MESLPAHYALFWLNWALKFLDYILDLLFGTTITKGPRKDRLKVEDYESSAQVVKVLFRARQNAFKVTKLSHFLYTHEEYVNPRYILENKNVTLVTVKRDHAVFSVTDPDIDVYDTTKYPFLIIFQYTLATKLVILPTKSFHRLADELGDPKVPVAIMGMTARCGSTLITQAFNRIPGARSVSEPFAMSSIHELRVAGTVTPDESRRLLRSAIRLHCKVEPDSGVKSIFIKLSITNTAQFKDFRLLFPEIKLFFNTRHPKPSMKSFKQIIESLESSSIYYRWGLDYYDWVGWNFNLPYDTKNQEDIAGHFSKWYRNVSRDELTFCSYAGVMANYFQSKNVFDRVVLYENISDDPGKELGEIFDLMDISRGNLPLALKAFERDSQNGTFGQRGQGPSYEFGPEVWALLDEYMKKMGLPEVRHDMTVPEFKKIFGF